MEKKERIALGMSGGVDSATSAAVLMQAGYEVVGITCLFVNDKKSKQAGVDAAQVCARLGIEHQLFTCTQRFENEVVRPFVADYALGLTPSPCVVCNAHCKIPALMEAAKEFNCTKVSTGHYARIAHLIDVDRFVVKTALDVTKDQSYMIALLSQEQLSCLILPLGGTTKTDVRFMAEELELPVAHKKDSQDICFIEGSYTDFLDERGIKGEPGEIVDVSGKVLGTHGGLEKYTIGQRKGIGVGGAAEPYYVIEKRAFENELVVGFQRDTFISGIIAQGANWQAFRELDDTIECSVKIRYRSKAVPCVISPQADNTIRVNFNSEQPITSPGQYAVFYLADTVLGGAPIVALIPSEGKL